MRSPLNILGLVITTYTIYVYMVTMVTQKYINHATKVRCEQSHSW